MSLSMLVLAIAAAQPGTQPGARPDIVAISSPDGSNAVRIAGDGTTFAVTHRGDPVVAPSPLGVEPADGPAWRSLSLVDRRDGRVDERVRLTATKASAARNAYRWSRLTFMEQGSAPRRIVVEVRAYDDGIAFRYVMEAATPIALAGERTAFVLDPADACFASRTVGAHEARFEATTPATMAAGVRFDVPVVCTTASGRTGFAIAQADLQGYAGASLIRDGDRLKVDLSSVPGRAGPAFAGGTRLTTAWRVVMLADRPGELIASDLIGNLNPGPPGASADVSWIKPGKAAWDWWSGPFTGMPPSMASYRRFIDFAAASGFPYYVIDAGWAHGSGPCCEALPTTDITRAVDGIDMPALVRYAASKGVRLVLWAHWIHVAKRMDEALDTYRGWGVAGVKIDFMDRDDQQIVDFYYRLADATAKRHLLLDLHGAYPPAGLNRTYPHFLTQEGVMGAEHNKWSRDITPAHNVTLAYTRMLVGPMDYTPGGMRNATPATFAVRDVAPMTQTTRGQALAMFVVYESAFQMVADDPDAYRGAAGFDFIRQVPTAWDETRFLSGTIGRDIVLARRSGSNWYVGAMTDGDARVETVSLGFLGKGRYRATIWSDGARSTEVLRTERTVSMSDTIDLHLAPAGGAAMVIEALP